MDRLRAWRTLMFGVLCLSGVSGVWAAHSMGHETLGLVGGVMVATVAALFIGATVWIIGILMFGRR